MTKGGNVTFNNNILKYIKKKIKEDKIVDRFYPSSKICSCCGNLKKRFKIK